MRPPCRPRIRRTLKADARAFKLHQYDAAAGRCSRWKARKSLRAYCRSKPTPLPAMEKTISLLCCIACRRTRAEPVWRGMWRGMWMDSRSQEEMSMGAEVSAARIAAGGRLDARRQPAAALSSSADVSGRSLLASFNPLTPAVQPEPPRRRSAAVRCREESDRYFPPGGCPCVAWQTNEGGDDFYWGRAALPAEPEGATRTSRTFVSSGARCTDRRGARRWTARTGWAARGCPAGWHRTARRRRWDG